MTGVTGRRPETPAAAAPGGGAAVAQGEPVRAGRRTFAAWAVPWPGRRVDIALLGAFTALTAVALGLLALGRAYAGYGTETDFVGTFVPEAVRILAGGPLWLEYHPPAYSAVLAAVYLAVRDWFTSGLLLTWASGLVSVAATFLLFRRLGGRAAAAGAALALAGSPMFLAYGAMATSDVPFLALVSALLLAVAWSWGSGSPRRWALAGLLAGLAILTRTNGVAFLALLAAPAFQSGGRTARRDALAFLGGALLLPGVWWVLAWVTGSPFTPSGTYANLAMTYFGPGDRIAYESLHAMQTRFDGLGDVLTHAPLVMAVGYVRDGAALVRRVFLEGDLLLFPLPLLALPGLLLFPGRARSARLLAVLAAVVLIQVAIVNLKTYEARYYLFLVPWLGAAAGLVAAEAVARVRSRRWRVGLGVLGVALVLIGLDDGVWHARELLRHSEREAAVAAEIIRRHAAPGDIIVSRKPQLAFYTGAEWLMIPTVAGVAELRRALADPARAGARGATFLYLGPTERYRRPELAVLADPSRAPDWLEPLVVRDGAVLYRVRTTRGTARDAASGASIRP